jgi:hypothetical protein
VDIASIGAVMYWCEGSKRDRDYRVEFVNSDPIMVRVFMKYLRGKGIEESRIRVRLSVHAQDNIGEFQKYWETVTSLNDSNFMSASVRKTSPAKTPLPHGTITIRYNSIALLREIKKEISALADELLRL